MHRAALALLALAVVACGPARPAVTVTPLPPEATIVVLPFTAPTSVVSYEGPTERLGDDFAARIVAELDVRGRPGRLGTAPEPGAVTVVGRLLRVDGGSWAKRFWLGFGAGRASLSAEGTVAATEPGAAQDRHLIEKCLDALAGDVAEMVVTGRYREVDLRR